MATGVLAVFKSPSDLMEAAKTVKGRAYKNWDCFTPFPVHGLDDAMGIKRSWLPYVTFGSGLVGLASAAFLQIWTSAIDWPINIGGKPMNSLPAFVPIGFELTVLIAGLSTVFAMLAVNKLKPTKETQVLDPRFTCDHFGLFIESTDPKYSESEVQSLLKSLKADEVRVINHA